VTVSAEAKTALLSGKKLRCAKLMLALPDEAWSCSFDVQTFVVRSLNLPAPRECSTRQKGTAQSAPAVTARARL